MREELKKMFNKINTKNEDVLIEGSTVIGTKENVIKQVVEDYQYMKETIINDGNSELEYKINTFEEMQDLLCNLKLTDKHDDNDIIMLNGSLMGNYKYIVSDNLLYDELTYYIQDFKE